MTDEKRPEFKDRDHPLATTDREAQVAISERIVQAMESGRKRPPKKADDATANKRNKVLDLGGPRRMGEREYRVTQDDLARLWGKSVPTARAWVSDPARIPYLDAVALADELGVDLDWLRYGGENGYGLWESPEVVALLYAELGNEDKQTLCRLLKRLAGPDAVHRVRWNLLIESAEHYYSNHPAEREQLNKSLMSFASKFFKLPQTGVDIARTILDMSPLGDALKNAALPALDLLPTERLEQVRWAVRVFESHGIDPAEYDGLTVGEVIERAKRIDGE